jgi:hypothetical protein
MAEKALCSQSGCGKPVNCKGYCANHYYRFRTHGDPMGGRTPKGEPLAWIERHKSHAGDECLIWPFARFSNGYGAVVDPSGRTTHAAIVMCIAAHGPAPEGKPFALHSCAGGKNACTSQRHIRWGTQAENMADSVADGTRCRGERQHASKLTEDDVRMIRSSTASAKSLGELLDIHEDTVRTIRNRKSWAWLK